MRSSAEQLAPGPVLVRELPEEARCYIDPRASHVAWAALEVVALRLGAASSPADVGRSLRGMADVLLHSYEPERTAVFTRIASVHDGTGRAELKLSLALGVLGAPDETATAAEHLVRAAQAALQRQPAALTFERADPALLLDESPRYAATIAQRRISLADDTDEVRVVSRWDHPAPETWEELSQLFLHHPAPLVMQASFAATQLSPTEALELEQNALAAEQIRQRAIEAHNPVVAIRAARIVETLSDLHESYGGPLWAGSVVVGSPECLPRPLLRSVANAISSELDVVHAGQAAPVVAARARLVGGYEIDESFGGAVEAIETLRVGLPAGMLRQRRLEELFSPAEAGLAFRFMLGRIPTLPVEGKPAIVPPADLPNDGVGLGRDATGKPVHLGSAGHVWLQGATGGGKSTALLRVIDFALEHEISCALLDPHGSTVRAARAMALKRQREIGLFDPSEEETLSLDLLGGIDVDTADDDEIAKVVGRAVVDAASSHLPDSWSGVRWQQLARAAGEIAVTAAPHMRLRYEDIARLMIDERFLEAVLESHPRKPEHSALVLRRMHRERDPETSLWASSKFDSLARASIARALFAPFREGVSVSDLLGRGIPLLADLSDGSRLESRLAGHVFLTSILDWVYTRPPGERHPVFLLVDEAPIFPPIALARALAESRKYGAAVWVGNQSAAQLDEELGSALEANAARVFFRLGVGDAHYFAPLMGLSTDELTRLPNLHALVQLPGKSTFSVAMDPPPTVGELPAYGRPPDLKIKRYTPRPLALNEGDDLPFDDLDVVDEEPASEEQFQRILAHIAAAGKLRAVDASWLMTKVRATRVAAGEFEIFVQDAATAKYITSCLGEALQEGVERIIEPSMQLAVRALEIENERPG